MVGAQRVHRAQVRAAECQHLGVAGFAAFAVPPGADEDFLAAWREDGAAGAALYRALNPDEPFRFVELAPDGPYEVINEDGEPEGDGGVLLIARLAPDDRQTWESLRAGFAPQRGYLGARMLARDELVAIVRWSSPLMYARALRKADIEELPGRPALYLAQ